MKPILSGTLKGALFAAAFILLALLVSSLVLLRSDDPDKLLTLFAFISLYAGAFLGGFVSAKGSENKLISGVFTGIVLMLVLFLFSLVFGERDATSALRMILTVVFASAGAVLHPRGHGDREYLKKKKNAVKKYGAYR